MYQTSDFFLRALIGYSSSGYPLDIYWFAKHNGRASVYLSTDFWRDKKAVFLSLAIYWYGTF